jgi:hypothetical protein
MLDHFVFEDLLKICSRLWLCSSNLRNVVIKAFASQLDAVLGVGECIDENDRSALEIELVWKICQMRL